MKKTLGALAVVGSLLCLVGVVTRKRRPMTARENASTPSSPFTVRSDGERIVVETNGKVRESMLWDDVVAVGVRIEDGFLPTPWWVVFGRTGGDCVCPNDAIGLRELIEEMGRRLPRFDDDAVYSAIIKAMRMVEGSIKIWVAV